MKRLLDSYNDTKHEYDRSSTVVDLFLRAAARYPDKKAVICGEDVLSYREMDDISALLANCIHGYGEGKGSVVAVLVPRNCSMVTISMGILRSGAAYLPLDLGYPDERLSFMLQDAGARLVIASEDQRERATMIAGNRARVLTVLGTGCPCCEETAVDSSQMEPETLPSANDLFMLIYTSGTTGIPKGVKLLHRNVMAYTAWFRRYFGIDPRWKVSFYNSYGFDGSIADMYPALTTGAGIVVIPEEMKLDLPALAETVRREKICLMDLPSRVGRQFALTMYCPDLKYVVVGGERLIPFRPVYPYTVINEYGPTETTVSVSYYCMTEYEEDIPIGHPSDNTAIYIVDEEGNRLAPGEKGELWVAGELVTGGYLNRPEETDRAFIPNPFSNEPGYETVYRTGDMASYDEDGTIRFHGRKDGLVKIRGFRIELSEVEDVLRSHPDISDVAVTAFDSPKGGQFLAAYYVSDISIDRSELVEFIEGKKPHYMVPAYFERIDRIPLNRNGKQDKNSLIRPALSGEEDEYIEPADELETELCRGFAAALGLDRVGAQSGFFDMGGDSISVMHLITECPSLCLSYRLIFEGRTPTGIASLIRERDTAARDMECKKGDGDLKGHFFGPLQRIHYEWGNEISEGYGLHCDATIHLGKETDPLRLAQAVASVIKAHPALDARLMETEDGTFRWFCEKDGLKEYGITPEYVTRTAYSELQGKLRKNMNRPGERMFVIRIFIITEEDGTENSDLYFDFLHPIIDGDSIDIFLEDVNAAYEGREVEKESFSVLDYYDQIEKEVSTDRYCREIAWNRRFAASFTDRIGELDGDLSCGDENETLDIFEKLDIEPEIVENYAAECKVTVGSLLSAAYGLMQASCNGEHGAVTLTIYNGRDDARYERTMGAIYRHLPLCVRFDEDMTALDFVRGTEENILNCRAHVLFEPDPVPIITAFSYQGEDPPEPFPFCSGLASYEETEDYEEEIFDFFVHRRQDGFYVNLTYNTLSYSKTFIDRFLKDYAMVLRSLSSGVSPADIRISCCSLIKSHNGIDDENEQQA